MEEDFETRISISSPAFKDNGTIPKQYTCDGSNLNPPLEIKNIPQGTKSLAIVVDDADSDKEGGFVHWVIYSIDPETTHIKEGFVPPGAKQGKNDFGNLGFGGPCPHSGLHHYFFKLYALDVNPEFEEGMTKEEFEIAIEGCILDSTNLIGSYEH